MIITVFFYAFVAATVILISYYLSFSVSIFHSNSTKNKTQTIPISVIICAKNEAENLQKFLPSVINQHYPKVEIILINDASSDETLSIMEGFQQENNTIKIVNVKNIEAFWGNKKYALTLGIKAATNEHLLFIDADCKPVSKYWIQEMSSQFTKEKSIVLGYGKYESKKHSLINLLVRFETLLTAIQYFSYAKLGSPYMAVGRNLAYKKSEFFSVKGFINHINIRSGDDDLFIQDAANKINTTICTSLESFTISKAPETLNEWFRQKRRHVSTASYYKKRHQFSLGLFYFSKVIFYITSIGLFFFYPWEIMLPIVVGYFTIQYLVIGLWAKKLEETNILYYLPLLEIFLMLFQFAIFITNLVSKPTHWK